MDRNVSPTIRRLFFWQPCFVFRFSFIHSIGAVYWSRHRHKEEEEEKEVKKEQE